MALDNTDDKRIIEVVNFALENGDAEACEVHGIKQESLSRYKREYRKRFGEIKRRQVVEQILSQYSDAELKAIAKGGLGIQGSRRSVVTRDGETIKFGFLTDTHIGSKYFHRENLDEAFSTFDSEGCEFIVHSGDVTEGMSNRPGHVYELTEIGYTAQRDKAVELLSEWERPFYFIDGNHDRWFIKSSGAFIVDDIVSHLPNAEYLGSDEGEVIVNGAVIRLYHGEDSSSYATSYRLQKLIESFTGGTKPNVLLCGHTHKQGYFFDRNIHVVSGGCIQNQSKWMRGKRIAAHTGYWIIEMTITDDGVTRFKPEWFPFFT
jgi:predicted phosphodiesterase